MKKIIRITTIAGSLGTLLKGQLKFMNCHYEVIGIASGDDLFKVGENEGIRTIPVEMTRVISPIKDCKGLWELYKIFKKEKPFIVHTHTPKAGTLGMIAAKLAGVPHRLHTIAGLPLLETSGMKRQLLNVVEKLTYACATLVLPNSYALQKIIVEENFCSLKKSKVIGNGSSNGIDTEHYNRSIVSSAQAEAIRSKFNISTEDTVYLFIGRIVKDKGINELVEAFDALSRLNTDMQLILVGYKEQHLNPIDPKTEHLINTNPKIHETGDVEDIRPYVAISNVLTFPSYREGFPNVVLQASCMETPCIVTDINGCNEIISHNFNGLIIPTKDTSALMDAMLSLYNNADLTLDMARNARPNIIKKYKREFIWKELLELYANLDR